MGGLALLARERGYEVAGCDANVYPPMSTQLAEQGISLDEGYDPAQLPADATIVVGNALSRGNPCVEAMLNRGLSYCSGPQWLAEHILVRLPEHFVSVFRPQLGAFRVRLQIDKWSKYNP